MSGASSPANDDLARLIETRLLGVEPDSQDLVLEDHDWRRILAALASTPEPAEQHREAEAVAGGVEAEIEKLVTAWHGGWSYEFGPGNVPNGVIEVAFDAGLGYTHVKICERKITRNMATYDRPLPLDQYEYGYFDEYNRDVSDGRPPYAWRKIALPPHPRPFAIDQPRDIETFIHNHCPDRVRDYVAALTARAASDDRPEVGGEAVEVVAAELERLAQDLLSRCESPLSAGGKNYDVGYATGLSRAAGMVRAAIAAMPLPPAPGEGE